MSTEQKIHWISHLRVLATLGVIILHVSATPLYFFNPEHNNNWWIGNIIDSSVRFCVPVFLMISGALMLGKSYSPLNFLTKKFMRVVLPFLFWTFVYILYNTFDSEASIKQPEGVSYSNWVWSQFQNGSSYHLWYIYMLLYIYQVIFLLNFITLKIPRIAIEISLMSWISFLIFFDQELFVTNFEFNWKFIIAYSGYPILGFYLSKYTFNKLLAIISGIMLFCGSVFFTILLTYKASLLSGGFDKYYYAYTSYTVLGASIGIFLIFRYVQRLNLKNVIISRIDRNTYGIYLSHVLILNYLSKIGIDWYTLHPIFGIIITSIISFTFSFAIIELLSKISFAKKITG